MASLCENTCGQEVKTRVKTMDMDLDTDGIPEEVEPDWDAMTDEQFEAHLAEQRAKGERKEAWRLWLEAHPYGFAKGGV